MAVEGSGAVPAGTYRPTAPSGTIMRSQITPGEVSRLQRREHLRFVEARHSVDGAAQRRELLAR